MRLRLLLAILALCLHAGIVSAQQKTIGVFVALADPKHQGIGPVPAAIGDGDNADTNLYWGNEEGLRGVFDHSKKWKLTEKVETPQAEAVLSKRTYKRVEGDVVLVARAYRGSQMKKCIEDYETAMANGEYDLVVFIGHDGLMDFQLPLPAKVADAPTRSDCVALCCISERYFKDRMLAAGARPALLTTQLMYPGAFVLEAIIDPWLARKSRADLREAAGAAYARNQKISKKAGMGVFAEIGD